VIAEGQQKKTEAKAKKTYPSRPPKRLPPPNLVTGEPDTDVRLPAGDSQLLSSDIACGGVDSACKVRESQYR
jgi:hypothetical protein